MPMFQVKLGSKWINFTDGEDKILKRAFMGGYPNLEFRFCRQNYIYDFRKMVQTNKDTGKIRRIRQPKGWKAPLKPLVPAGPTTVASVPRGSPGTTIKLPHPRSKGSFISVKVPASATAGQTMLVPVPSAVPVAAADIPAPSKGDRGCWSTAGKVAVGAAGVLGATVGGAILGEYTADCGFSGTCSVASEATTSFFSVDAGEFFVDAREDLADFIMDLF
jgi:hypothetical protein